MEIRPVERGDAAAVRAVQELAFGGPGEALLVERLQAAGADPVSLVAVDEGRVVGHALFSPVELDGPYGPDAPRLVGLGPIAVLPKRQGQGIGSRLIRAGLDDCRAQGFDAVVVLGDPAFYGRFGFVPASNFRIGNEYGAGARFMALELRPGALAGAGGLARYRHEFAELPAEPPPTLGT
ncbi:MAG: N-acetyltransferase [Thermomicrobiales bacterium]|nr:N-acetyltransferase [Thermomicrobiales bacterium]